ncbi:alpha/beta hydrolase [Nocardia brasiliensis]|uniref:alpha/beta hydrolase n=1 Tax=Nocardia brasiliensis TaxID=37326 RepID=UPI0024568C88|nr:alpha/beta hydrolase [Nocardia brasiliensis]
MFANRIRSHAHAGQRDAGRNGEVKTWSSAFEIPWEKTRAPYRAGSEFPVIARDGVHLSAARVGAASAPASVVYVHGVGAGSGCWTPLVEHLHRQLEGGIAQYIYRQRSHGHSESHSRGAPLSLGTLIADLDSVLGQVSGAVVLAAHSAATVLVLEWARHNPGRAKDLAGIVLFNAFCEIPTTLATSRQVLRCGLDRGDRCGSFEGVISHLHSARDTYALSRARQRADVAVETELLDEFAEAARIELSNSSAAVSNGASAEVLREIPTWVLAGQLDPFVPADRSRNFAEQIWADYGAIPGAGHWLPCTDPGNAADPILAALEVAYRASRDHIGGGW